MAKDFDKKLHDKYDGPAKDTFEKFMEWYRPDDIVTRDPFGRYGVDFSINRNGKMLYLDVEVRTCWVNNDDFPFDTIHLPSRKLKFVLEHINTYFLSMNTLLTRGLLFRVYRTDVMVQVDNIYVTTGEEFIDIPIGRCEYLELIKEKNNGTE